MADKSPANQLSELLTCMETGISNGLCSVSNLDMASSMMLLNPHKIQLNVIKIDLTLLFRLFILTFYCPSLLVGGYSRLFAFSF